MTSQLPRPILEPSAKVAVNGFFAYRILCVPTGKSYVGITSQSISRRINKHLQYGRSDGPEGQTLLCRALRKYGPGFFRVEALAEAASWEELLVLERGLIAEYGTFAP